jgi:hypothetical protein
MADAPDMKGSNPTLDAPATDLKRYRLPNFYPQCPA